MADNKGNSGTLVVDFTPEAVQQLKDIAPAVGADPKKPEEVLRKAVKLLDFAKNGLVSVTKPNGTYSVNLTKL